MPKDAIEPGRVLAGRFRLEAVLGTGGFGTVWRAQHLVLEAPVAVKLIDPEIAEDEIAVERFLREAKAAASLRSPHVVQILDYGVDDGQPFIAMELLEGETLAHRIKRVGRLEAAEALRILGHVARAIGRAHDAGVVHRDLKPENVFLIRNDDEEIAKVLDFGVAKLDANKLGVQSTATRTGSLLGTPFYMSPEQVLGNKEVDRRSDLWSLGVIAFEMITGRRPFVSDGLGDLVLQITVHPLPVPSQFAPVPLGFDAWFARVMTRDPGGRLASAREVVESLREALDLGTDSADTVVTVPEPGEELPAALRARRPYATDPPPGPARRRDASTAPTILAGAEDANPAASDEAGPTVPDFPRGERPARARGETATVSQFSAPAEAPRRGWGVRFVVAASATVIGLLGGLTVYSLRDQTRPLPTVAAPEVRAAVPADVEPRREDDTTATATPSAEANAEPSASPAASAEPPVESTAAPSASASAAATVPSAESGKEPPPEWLPKEIDGKIVKPDWARPEPEAPPPPPPPPEEDSPYD